MKIANCRTHSQRLGPDKVKAKFAQPGKGANDNPAWAQNQDIILHLHSSVQEELEYARHAISTGYNPYGGGEGVEDQPKGKIGRSDLNSFEDAFKAAERKWDEGNKIFHKCMTEVSREVLPLPLSNRRRPIFNPWEGDEVDRDRLYAGQDFWRGTSKRLLSQSNTVCVIVNCSSPWSREGAEIMWRGVAGTLIADQLEDAGYRVELWACRAGTDVNYDPNTGDDIDVYASTLVKDSSQPLNWPIMINTMTGWYYRCISWCSFYYPGTKSRSNLGYPVHTISPWQAALLLRKDLDLDKTLLEQGIVVCEDLWDKDAALDKVTEILGAFTGHEQYTA